MKALPLRIFISYGRADAAAAAVALADSLRKAGYEPWLDTENGIPLGEPFDLRIELGIAESDALVALLSPWSLRPEGFCRNELLYAQARDKPIVPVRIAEVTLPIQIISLNYVDALGAAEDPVAAFAELPQLIAKALAEGGVGRRAWPAIPVVPLGTVSTEAPAPDAVPWWAAPAALDFNEELARHGGSFVGREWLFDLLAERLAEPGTRLVLLEGSAGIGKSALAAQATARLNVKGVHFASRSNAGSCRPQSWLQELAFQLAAQFEPYRARLARLPAPDWDESPEALFRSLIAAPLAACREELAVEEPWVFVLDGLDEATAEAGPALAELLSRSLERLPDFLRLLVTTRPDRDARAQFARKAVTVVTLAADDAGNLADLAAYVAARLDAAKEQLGSEITALAAALLAGAAGNFLCARVAADALSDPDPARRLSPSELAALPPGLGGLYHEMFGRRFADEHAYEADVLPLLDCLCAAKGPLTEELLIAASGLGARAAHRGLRALSQFSERTPSGLRLFHQSLAEWLADEAAAGRFAALAEEGARRLADACLAELAGGASAYTLAHLTAHLREQGRWDDLAAALADLAFLAALWKRDEHEAKRSWAALEARSAHRMTDAYAEAIASADPDAPGVAQLQVLLAATGHPREAYELLEHLIARARATGDTVRLGAFLNNQAWILHDWGRLDEAMARYAELEPMWRELGNVAGLVASLCNQAKILYDWGRLEDSMARFKDVERIYCELGDRSGLHHSLGGQANILHDWGRLEEALVLRENVERICRALGDPVGLQVALGDKALTLQGLGRLEEAMALHEEKERICRELGDQSNLAICLGNQANILNAWGRLDEAMALHEEEERISRRLDEPDNLQRSLGGQARILHGRGRLDEAMALLKEQERICRQLDNPADLQRSLCAQVLILRDWGRLEEAMALSEEHERICRRLGNAVDLSASLGNQAMIFYDWGRLDDALAKLGEVERISREVGIRARLETTLGIQAAILGDLGRPEEAMARLEEQERICRELRRPADLQACLSHQAMILYASGSLEDAMALLKEQERICRELGDPAGLGTGLYNQARYLLDAGRPAEALPLIEESVAIARDLGSPALDGRLELLDRILRALGEQP